ncbi:MAG: PQQ-dependent sugar dehydrogenase, partial [Myxococcales bacterium]|nr:PQQ-dependent sugar dehydrogenase [Myxococcales bacterium]
HRNGFGIAPDLTAGGAPRVYVSENGPKWGDEINLVRAGDNAGWPRYLGPVNVAGFVDPIHTWLSTVGPTGVVRYRGEAYPAEYRGNLIVGHFNAPLKVLTIERFELDAPGERVTRSSNFLQAYLGGAGFVIDVAEAPDGFVYFTTGAGIYRIVYGHGDRDADGCVDVLDPYPAVASVDGDGDGYGADCDCDDANPGAHPGAVEIVGNSVDEDCDPSTPAMISCSMVAGGRGAPSWDLALWMLPLGTLVAMRRRRG